MIVRARLGFLYEEKEGARRAADWDRRGLDIEDEADAFLEAVDEEADEEVDQEVGEEDEDDEEDESGGKKGGRRALDASTYL